MGQRMERNNNGRDGRDKEGTIDRATFLWLAPTITGHISDLGGDSGVSVGVYNQAGEVNGRSAGFHRGLAGVEPAFIRCPCEPAISRAK